MKLQASLLFSVSPPFTWRFENGKEYQYCYAFISGMRIANCSLGRCGNYKGYTEYLVVHATYVSYISPLLQTKEGVVCIHNHGIISML